MSRKRPGWRAAERTYRYLTADLARKAKAERERNARSLLREAIDELRQIHAHHYPKCDGGCPSDDIIKRAGEYLAQAVRP